MQILNELSIGRVVAGCMSILIAAMATRLLLCIHEWKCVLRNYKPVVLKLYTKKNYTTVPEQFF